MNVMNKDHLLLIDNVYILNITNQEELWDNELQYQHQTEH